MPPLLSTFDLEDVKVQSRQFALDLGKRSLLVGKGLRLPGQTVDGGLHLVGSVR